jgi:type VI secretion system protein ImpM
VLGVMIPSVDKVGRYFPLAILIELADLELDEIAMALGNEMLHKFEDLLLGALSEEIDQDYFDYQVGQAARKHVDKPAHAIASSAERRFADGSGLTQHLEALNGQGGSLWWTEGSDSRRADLLIYRSMPGSAVFASFLRDPSHFRDLEWAWDAARDLGATQQDNQSVDLTDRFPTASFHLISHRGTDHGQYNTSAAVFSPKHPALLISDGRFGTKYFAMASRLLGNVIPALLSLPGKVADDSEQGNRDSELERVTSFLSTKFVDVMQSTLSPPLSFACLLPNKPRSVELLVAGDYFCMHKGRHGISRIFNAPHSAEDPTIRQGPAGLYKSVVLKPEAGDRLLLSNAAFDSQRLEDDVHDAFAAPKVDQAAKSLWQNATIKGLPGNVVLAVVDFAEAGQPTSELQSELGIE